MKIGIDPTIDYAFKKIFGTEENKELLLKLINAVLEEQGEMMVTSIELANPFNPKEYEQDKLSVVDVRAYSERGEWFNIEVQIIMHDYYPKRLLYYWSRNYQSQMLKGFEYDRLKKTTVISISKNNLPLETSSYFNHFQILCVQDKKTVFCDDLSLYTIELAKFTKQGQAVTRALEKWTYFLKHGEALDTSELPSCLEDQTMQQAIGELNRLSQDEKERAVYESRRMALLDAQSSIGYTYRKGVKEGKIEGKIEAIATALEIKFGVRGLEVMARIQTIGDLDRLDRILAAAKRAADIAEFEREIAL